MMVDVASKVTATLPCLIFDLGQLLHVAHAQDSIQQVQRGVPNITCTSKNLASFCGSHFRIH